MHGVVHVEVVRAVLAELQRWPLEAAHQHSGVGPRCTQVGAHCRPGHAQRRQQLRHAFHQRQRGCVDAPAQLPHTAGAEVAFAHPLVRHGAVTVTIVAGAVEAVFFIAEQHHAHRAARALAEALQQPSGGGDDGHAGAVVQRALAQVPAVEMGADEHDLVREVGARHFADHVVRGGVDIALRLQVQLQTQRLALCVQSGHGVGVGHRHGKGRDARHADFIAHGAGVGDALASGGGRGADGADGQRQCTAPGGFHGAAPARADRSAIAPPVARAFGFLVDEDDAAARALGAVGLERVEVGIPGHVGFDATLGRSHAVAQGQHHQWLLHGRQQPRRCWPAHPSPHRHAFGANLGQTQLFHGFLRPGGSLRIGRRTRRPRANLVAQLLHQGPGRIVGQRGVAQAFGMCQVGG